MRHACRLHAASRHGRAPALPVTFAAGGTCLLSRAGSKPPGGAPAAAAGAAAAQQQQQQTPVPAALVGPYAVLRLCWGVLSSAVSTQAAAVEEARKLLGEVPASATFTHLKQVCVRALGQ